MLIGYCQALWAENFSLSENLIEQFCFWVLQRIYTRDSYKLQQINNYKHFKSV